MPRITGFSSRRIRNMLCIMVILSPLPLFVGTILAEKTLALYDFSHPDELEGWTCISDRIRGGSSMGTLNSSTRHTALFSGELNSKEIRNFCMVCSPRIHFQLRAYGGLLLRLKGDGKHYKLCIYTQPNIEGVSYQAGFNTRKNRLITVFLPFSSFIPFLDQRVVRKWPVMDLSSIDRIGIMVSDQPPGPFQLEIYWINAKRH